MHAIVRPTNRDLARGLARRRRPAGGRLQWRRRRSDGAVARRGIERFGDLFRRARHDLHRRPGAVSGDGVVERQWNAGRRQRSLGVGCAGRCDGVAVGYCDGLPDCASWIPLAADFTQDGATVTGTVTSTFAAPPNYEWTIQSGTVSIDGTLSLTSDEIAYRVPDDGVEIRARLMSWESRADTAGVMTGTAIAQYSSDALSGDAVVEGCLEADKHPSGVLRVAAAGWEIRQSRRAPRLSASRPVRQVEGQEWLPARMRHVGSTPTK